MSEVLEFVELSPFTREAERLLGHDGIIQLQQDLISDPEAGDLIRGTGGLRKIRCAASGRGKRGGARALYYWYLPQGTIYLLAIYAKNQHEDLTATQRSALSTIISQIKTP